MKKHIFSARKVIVCAAVLCMSAALGVVYAKAPPRKAKAPGPAYALSGPYTHKNLTVFLIHGADRIKAKKIITLEEALKQKKAVVKETGNVKQLIIVNNSNVTIFIQSGDIVQGGKQDRCIRYDLLLAPKSGKVEIEAFCVEQGRWRGRGNEAVGSFDVSSNRLNSRGLKMAVRLKGNQGEVWKSVSKEQDKLSINAGKLSGQATTRPVNVRSSVSGSSLQLTLENKNVKKAVEGYTKKLSEIVKGKGDVIGMAFAINGKVNGADSYASSELFLKLWPKLLKASAVEAIAEFDEKKKFDTPTVPAVETALADARKGSASEKRTSKFMKSRVVQSRKAVYFMAIGKDGDAVHESTLIKDQKKAK